MSAVEQNDSMLMPESSGEDSEVEISGKDPDSEIREMKLKLIDACDKMGPRIRHILQYFVRDHDLSTDEPPPGAKTFLKISNSQDFKPISRRMKCLFTELLSDDEMFKKDGFKSLMPSHTLYVPECNSLLLSYSDYRIQSLVLSILKDSMQI